MNAPSGGKQIGLVARRHQAQVPVGGLRGHAAARYLPRPALVLLSVTRHDGASQRDAAEALRARYGCTPAETRLVMGLLQGHSLREAARSAGTTYESARTTLKRVFAKVGVHSQSQLVTRLLHELPPPH